MKIRYKTTLVTLLACFYGFTVIGQVGEDQADRLIKAVVNSDTKSVEMLLELGLDVNSQNKAGLTAYQAARLRGDIGMAQLLAGHGAVTNAPMPSPDKLVDALFTQRAEYLASNTFKNGHLPGLAIGVAVNGKTVFLKGFGYSDIAAQTPINPTNSQFRIGSISKPLTAAGLGKLYEEGKVDLDASIYECLPEFPEKRWPFSTRQLAGHLAVARDLDQAMARSWQVWMVDLHWARPVHRWTLGSDRDRLPSRDARTERLRPRPAPHPLEQTLRTSAAQSVRCPWHPSGRVAVVEIAVDRCRKPLASRLCLGP